MKPKTGNIIPNNTGYRLPAHKPVVLILCLMVFLCWTAISEAKIIEQILVIVGDDIITKTELDENVEKEKEMRRTFYQYDDERLAAEEEEIRSAVLERMINEMLFVQEAMRRGIKVSDSEVQQFVNTLRQSYDSPTEFREALEAEGYTEYSFMKERKRALLRDKLIKQEFGSELEVTDAEVRKFYRENRETFPAREDTVKLKHIFVKFETSEADKERARLRAEDILERCREGADFGEMAMNFSDHEPTKASGGDMGYFFPGMGQHDPMLEEAASKLAVGEISDLIETPVGYEIIKIIDLRENAVRAQRIFIAIKPSKESEKAAEEKISRILAEIEAGADFVTLAEKYSDDPMAAEKGGDWREISIDMMTPELKNAFDSFEEGEVSEPVKTPLGVHIFKIANRQDLTNDEIEQLRRFLSDKRLEEKLKEYSEKLKEKTYIKRLADN